MTAQTTTVVKITQNNTFTPTGQVVSTYLVQFMVGAHGPFTIQVPADQFTAANVKTAMQKLADEIANLPQGA